MSHFLPCPLSCACDTQERDYYPYWHPTIWTDIAILTSETQKCAAYQQHSQNMEDKGYCYWSDSQIQTYLNNNPRTDATGQVCFRSWFFLC